jgi:tRNA G10  N-methylase Trm11
MASDLNREISLEELEANYLRQVENRLEYIHSALSPQGSDEEVHAFESRIIKARSSTQVLLEFKSKIEALRKKAVAGKLTLGEAIQHLKTEPKKRKPRRRKVLTRYQRIMKSFS